MLNITFWKYGKKSRSTATPAAAGKTYPCKLLDGTSIIDPVVTIEGVGSEITAFNYAAIPEFSRYYFVSDIVSDGPFWVITLKKDPFASWKKEIGATNQYILRAASASNDLLTDNMYPTECAAIMQTNRASEKFWADSVSSGYFVVGINNADDRSSVGGVSYYAFAPVMFQKFRKAILGNVNWRGNITEIGADLYKALADPFSYIVSCIWLPLAPEMGTAWKDAIDTGFWPIPLPSDVFYNECGNDPVSVKSAVVTLPKHPQSAQLPWTKASPYTQYTLYLEPFGSVPLDSSALVNSDTVRVEVHVDYMTGSGRLRVFRSDGVEPTAEIIASVHCQVGVPIALNNLSNDYGSALSSIVGGFSGAVAGVAMGNFSAPIAGAANIIDGVAESFSNPAAIGSQGSMLPYSKKIKQLEVVGKFYKVTDTDPENLGKPLCENRVINTLHGYVKCDGAHLAIPATESEISEIIDGMESGFYYE